MALKASPGGRLTVENMPLRLPIQNAYNVKSFQIVGAPAWLDSERYDILAKAADAATEQHMLGPMLQRLLEARFGLRVSRQTKELPVLNLIDANKGAKLVRSNAQDCLNADSNAAARAPCHEVVLSLSPSGARLRGEQATTARLAFTLANVLGRPIVDKTEFSGQFDLDLEVSLDGLDGLSGLTYMGVHAGQTSESSAPSLSSALSQRLGLKLVAGKGPVEVLVIGHVERPSGN
jgi:uncharacterized protein (TIGR03435 family)